MDVMNPVCGSLLVLLIAAGSIGAQDRMKGELLKASGARSARWVDGEIVPGGAPDHSSSIWDNTGVSAWWSGNHTNYIHLDWGKLPQPASGLPDHVVDGFTFSYGTNNLDPAGDEYAICFYDSCTGWGSGLGTQEAGFAFFGLPNGSNLPTLPPGYGWTWSVTLDLEGTGYEFLLNREFGIGHIRLSDPAMGSSGLTFGFRHPGNGTENVFDVYYPNGTYNGTWWIGYPPMWLTWPSELFGTEGESNMIFYGVCAQGNEAGLYAAGDFTAGSEINFLLRENGLGLEGYLAASLSQVDLYLGGSYDVTRLVGSFLSGFPMAMDRYPVGDFFHLQGVVSPYAAGTTIYFQGILSDAPINQPPIDASNGIRAN